MNRRLPVVLLATLSACYSGGDALRGLAKTEPGDGPRIWWDLDAKPIAEIPFPNDIATRPDPTAKTGRRVNASLNAVTEFERRLRKNLAELDGFGTYAPVWVRFDKRLDLTDIRARQKNDAEFNDDAVLLIDVTPGSPTYGEAQVLDFGGGSFPVTIEDPGSLFESDPRDMASNIILETEDEDLDGDGNFDVYEDLNQNGELDPGEDVDGDGNLDPDEDTDADNVFDRPNTWASVVPGGGADPYGDLITFYELETNTLWFRPMAPLRQRTTYAVVLTKDLRDDAGNSIRSPFPYVNHLQQNEALSPLVSGKLLARYGRDVSDIAFAWTFTTQTVTDTLEVTREGLYGVGPMKWLEKDFAPEITTVVPMTEREGINAYLMLPEDIVEALNLIFGYVDIAGFDPDRIDNLLNTYGAVDYVVAGNYTSPDFLEGGDGVFDIDPFTGKGTQVPTSLRFLLVVPKQAFGTRPFPVALYCHGYTSMKLEALAFAGVLAKFGIATFAIDAYNHGLPVGGEYQSIIDAIVSELAGSGLEPFFDAMLKDRSKDLNNDGNVDPAGDFWTNDTFHTRDIVRQTVIDYLVALRVLRQFDGEKKFTFDYDGNGQLDDIAGDFNKDGLVDVAGPEADFFAVGTSMGGIVSSILGTVDPRIKAATPISPGGGLQEVGLRTGLRNVLTAVYMPMLGPMIIADPVDGDPRYMDLQFLLGDVFVRKTIRFARIGEADGGEVVNELRPGDLVRVENLKNGIVDEARVTAERELRLHIESDRGDPLKVTLLRPDGTPYRVIDTFERGVDFFQGEEFPEGSPLVALVQGLGIRRNTPRMRRLLGISQMILEPGDPVNYATLYKTPLDIAPEGPNPVNVVFYLTMGDDTVAVSSGVSLARAADVIGYTEPDPRYGVSQNQLLVDYHVIEAVEQRRYFENDLCRYDPREVNFDIDDLSNGLHAQDIPRLAELTPNPVCAEDDAPAACGECQTYPPLRATIEREGGGIRAVRFPALRASGHHAIDIPDPSLPFDPSAFVINQIGIFLRSRGTVLSDHPCLASDDCSSCAGEADCPDLPPRPEL